MTAASDVCMVPGLDLSPLQGAAASRSLKVLGCPLPEVFRTTIPEVFRTLHVPDSFDDC